MKNILIISFSPLYRDPRILRQIRCLSDAGYRITTLGEGPSPEGAAEHFEVPRAEELSRIQKLLTAARLLVRPAHKRYAHWPEVNRALEWVRDNRDRFDGVVANELIALPLATAVGKPLHLDLHEYSLDQASTLAWRLGQLPLVRWATRFLSFASSTSTVAPGIAGRYKESFGIDPFLVTNAPRSVQGITPTPTSTPIRLVHMGVGSPERALKMPIHSVLEANKEVSGRFTLDYYLVPGEQAYIEELRQLAGNPAVTGITIHDPVPFDQIIPTLHQHDALVVFYPPLNANLKHSLPNKFFEAVQARIGVITGPSPEMGPYIHEYGFGTTTTGWTQEDLDQTINSLTPQTINTWKQAANKAAPHLGAEQQDQKWLAAVERFIEDPEQ